MNKKITSLLKKLRKRHDVLKAEMRAISQITKTHKRNIYIERMKAARSKRASRFEQILFMRDVQKMAFSKIGIIVGTSACRTRQLYMDATHFGNAPSVRNVNGWPDIAIVPETKITDLPFTVRVQNVFNNANINTVGDLCEQTAYGLRRFRNFGSSGLHEVNDFLYHYKLKMKED